MSIAASLHAYLPLAAVAVVAGMVIFYLWRELRRAKAALQAPEPVKRATDGPVDEDWEGDDVPDASMSDPSGGAAPTSSRGAIAADAKVADATVAEAKAADGPARQPGTVAGLHRRPAAGQATLPR